MIDVLVCEMFHFFNESYPLKTSKMYQSFSFRSIRASSIPFRFSIFTGLWSLIYIIINYVIIIIIIMMMMMMMMMMIYSQCNYLSQVAYTRRICLIILYFQCQEITALGKYRITLNINSVGNYYVGLFLVYASV